MASFDHDENHTGVAQAESITLLDGLSEDEWQMRVRRAQKISPLAKVTTSATRQADQAMNGAELRDIPLLDVV
jgi:homoserine acetyltransferase